MKFTKAYGLLNGYGVFKNLKQPLSLISNITSLEQPLAFFCSFSESHRLLLSDVLDETQWNNLKTYRDSVFIYENCFEPTDYVKLAKEFSEIIITKKINPDQIYIILADDIQERCLKNELQKYNLSAIHTDYLTQCLLHTSIPKISNSLPTVNFSLMSRRFVKDRLLLLCELINNKLLDEFVYSFHNINPYTKESTSIDSSDLPLEYQTQEIKDWLQHVPYYVDNTVDNWSEQFSDKMYNATLKSKIHIVVETIFHETIYSYDQQNIVPWITEKTFKAIACKKVFLCYSMPGTLTTLQQMGFKTFEPLINESYDSIQDPSQRRKALVQEIKRISELDIDEINDKLTDITEHNFKVLVERQHKQWKQDFLDLGLFK